LIHISATKTKWSWTQRGIRGDAGAEGKKQQRVVEEMIFFHLAEDENTSLGRLVSFDISCAEMLSFDVAYHRI